MLTTRSPMTLAALALAGVTAVLSVAPAALAQAYPTRVVRLVVPFPPSGPTDIFARQYANGMSKVLNQQFIVENKAGAGGLIGTMEVKRADPDGYTLLFGTASNLVMYNLMAVKPQYDSLVDLVPVAVVGGSAVVITAGKAAPQALKAMVDFARANPNKLRYGSPGHGTYLHMSMERFNMESGAKIEAIHYKGSGQAKPALLGGQTELMVDALGSALPIHNNGARILALAAAKRSKLAPDVPTVDEALGIKGFEAVLWNGVAAPARTPKALIDTLAAATAKVIADPAFQEALDKLAMVSMDTTPESAVAFIRQQRERWKPVVDATGIKIE